ncbi:type I restriction enzyme HsdR N-terminal domain-containing protein [Agrobacterium tumefaciens]|uniref:type I restriction enzyme HsdR N-terminal domain-containing protein n=1 Tax=Agrobacterium tumefaciens TaxID=358 RepID=UPI001572E497|nr:type I restriction enzyme HsdR N-terminal domain-containing protein [Agrobacterium tumefaciens]NSZ85553.1 type I restriction enzyme HsdR N-terminal domain-containing protein [Agrobacterium tumefaciens]WCA70787.1 type I restriction enzyme HsdR N-terminal domain-containing protein [Agrobacterium tumefaciens]
MAENAFWDSLSTLHFSNEAEVETRLVLPLLNALGYQNSDIRPKPPVEIRVGSKKQKGRTPEADFVVYTGKPHNRNTAAIVVEAKRPRIPLHDGVAQAESYAQHLRAPLILVTNGVVMQIWQLQPTLDNDLVFHADVCDLASRRSDLEAIAGVEAVRIICANLAHKRVATITEDFSAFEERELDRLSALGPWMQRTLHDPQADQPVSSQSLVEGYKRGAIILGPSGYGKSMLAASLCVQAIELRRRGTRQHLVLEVFIPDVAVDETGIEKFLHERISRQVPQITELVLRDRIKRDGITVVADGFERLEPRLREKWISSLRSFCRDYPRAQVFVMSRATGRELATLGLPILRLDGYSESDLQRLMKLRNVSRPSLLGRSPAMSGHLEGLCKEPLIADLVVSYIREHNRYPTHVRPLYEDWVSRLLIDFGEIEKLKYRASLTALAKATRVAPLTFEEAAAVVSGDGNATVTLERLTDANAISITESRIELTHEALADYLRALAFIHDAGSDIKSRVEELDLEETSQFPRLLLAAAETLEQSQTIWDAIARANLQTAIDCLHLTPGTGVATGQDSRGPKSEAYEFLKVVLNALDTVVEAHLEPMTTSIRFALIGTDVDEMGIIGDLSQDHAFYAFRALKPGMPRIEVKSRTDAHRRFGINLKAFGLGYDAGRIIGIKAVGSALSNAIKARRIRGGMVWTEELVMSRINHLEREYKIVMPDGYALKPIRKALSAFEDRVILPPSNRRGQTFRMCDLIAHVDFLLNSGVTNLQQWWCDPLRLDLKQPNDQRKLAKSLDALHSRRQIAYAEIVENSFPALAPLLGNFRELPVRRNIEVEVIKDATHPEISLNYWDEPMELFSEAGAVVSFPLTPSDDWRSWEFIEELHLRNLGRIAQFSGDRSHFATKTGAAILRNLVVGRWDGDGLPDETGVVRDVVNWLAKDVRQLFEEVPGSLDSTN